MGGSRLLYWPTFDIMYLFFFLSVAFFLMFATSAIASGQCPPSFFAVTTVLERLCRNIPLILRKRCVKCLVLC